MNDLDFTALSIKMGNMIDNRFDDHDSELRRHKVRIEHLEEKLAKAEVAWRSMAAWLDQLRHDSQGESVPPRVSTVEPAER